MLQLERRIHWRRLLEGEHLDTGHCRWKESSGDGVVAWRWVFYWFRTRAASYDGTNLAKKGDVVVVTLNHRLNVLGFLDLSAYGDKYAKSGNAGLLDLVAALQWVNKNIKAFGGDPSNVTIFGQSGGGGKVSTLLATPAAKGLFHKAIVQSGSMLRTMESTYSRRIGKVHCRSVGTECCNN